MTNKLNIPDGWEINPSVSKPTDPLISIRPIDNGPERKWINSTNGEVAATYRVDKIDVSLRFGPQHITKLPE